MVEKDKLFVKVRDIILEQFGVEEGEIKLEANLVNDLGADSLDLVELTMACEEAFDIDISDEDAEKIATVGQGVEYLRSRLPSA